MSRNVVVICNNKTGQDKYYYEDGDFMPVELAEDEYVKRYACLSDAIFDSEPYKNENYSDGECLDYVTDVIKQMENR